MTRSRFITLWLLASLIVISIPSFAGAEGFTVVSKDQLKGEIAKPEVVVLDVRAPHDWDTSEWKIQGARRESPAEVGKWITQYPKDKTIVLYCA